MKLYIRKKSSWINYIHTLQELKEFHHNYIPGTPLLIGDLSTFTKGMANILLKLLEENPQIDCYSSRDINDKVLLSRFTQVEKEPLSLQTNPSPQDFMDSNRGFNAIGTYMPHIRPELQLRLKGASNYFVNLVSIL
jgi:hypothetical protein